MEGTCMAVGSKAMLLPQRFSLRLCRAAVQLRQPALRHMHLATCASASQQLQRQPRRAAHTDAAAADAFFARKANSFASLGLEGSLARALQAAGFEKPARVQELAVPAILDRKDVVLAAETGSGKTLAYLAPLIQLVLANRAAQAAQGGPSGEAGRQRQQHHTAALVLCPNVLLCEQVLAVARSLVNPDSGQPLAQAALVSSGSPPPLEMPHLVVTTPGALVTMMDNVGPAFGFEWTRAGLPLWARQVVFDEADLLLAGAYEKPLRVIMDLLRLADRESRMRHVCREAGVPEEAFRELPRHLKVAGLQGGAKGLLDAGFKPQGNPPAASSQSARSTPSSIAHGAPDSSADTSTNGTASAAAPGAVASSQALAAAEGAAAAPAAAPEARGGAGGPSSAPLWRRQYVFVAATMPVEGGSSVVGSQIERHFPSAVWLAGEGLHRVLAAAEFAWRQVGAPGAPTREEALKEVIAADAQLCQGRGHMLVFTRDVASANATARALQEGGEGGAPVLLFHRDRPQAERAASLKRMAQEGGCVMVCTDAAARGLDLPGISHVVQADFALSAIDFLHRVGRTARAGRSGRVTSLYGPESADLVEVIRAALEAGEPVEGAFSRKRSFRKKFKRYGQYVPCGQVGPQQAQHAPQQQRQGRQSQQAQQQQQQRVSGEVEQAQQQQQQPRRPARPQQWSGSRGGAARGAQRGEWDAPRARW